MLNHVLEDGRSMSVTPLCVVCGQSADDEATLLLVRAERDALADELKKGSPSREKLVELLGRHACCCRLAGDDAGYDLIVWAIGEFITSCQAQ